MRWERNCRGRSCVKSFEGGSEAEVKLFAHAKPRFYVVFLAVIVVDRTRECSKRTSVSASKEEEIEVHCADHFRLEVEIDLPVGIADRPRVCGVRGVVRKSHGWKEV